MKFVENDQSFAASFLLELLRLLTVVFLFPLIWKGVENLFVVTFHDLEERSLSDDYKELMFSFQLIECTNETSYLENTPCSTLCNVVACKCC